MGHDPNKSLIAVSEPGTIRHKNLIINLVAAAVASVAVVLVAVVFLQAANGQQV